MVFSDPAFLALFLPCALVLIWSLARFAHAAAILGVSLVFYFWSSGTIVFVLLFSIAFNWAWALVISKWRLRSLLSSGVVINLGFLLYFKYALFLASQADLIFGSDSASLFELVVLPIGISFFTFQSISYLIDVHRGDTEPERNIVTFGAYLSFFPQLIAGPIVRFRDVVSQYHRPDLSIENFSAGSARFTHGLLKKVLIADSAGMVADACFGLAAEQYSPAVTVLGCLAYTIQIYFDFSGYSDMAIGLGLIFGVRFNENFRHPYSSSSLTEFWRRWHISLSTWFRDYLYIPLGGNRGGKVLTYRNLFVVFATTGLWHGAAWNFLIWGLYHGVFLAVERMLLGSKTGQSNSLALRYFYLLPVVAIGWIFFRAEDLTQALAMIAAPFSLHSYSQPIPLTVLMALSPWNVLALTVGCLTFVAPRDINIGVWISADADRSVIITRLVYCLVGMPLALVFAFSSSFSPFLYFRF